MVRNLLMLTIVLAFASCSKELDQPIAPQSKPAEIVNITTGPVAITNVKAQVIDNGKHVQITFNTLKEIGCNFISVNSGTTENYLCSIMKWDINGVNSSKTKAYSFVDMAPKGKTMYYLIYYTANEEDWNTSNVVKVTLP
jgi:hypothetical protein